MDIFNNDEIPMELSMAFTQNLRAMNQFQNLEEAQRLQILNQVKQANTREELNQILLQMGKFY